MAIEHRLAPEEMGHYLPETAHKPAEEAIKMLDKLVEHCSKHGLGLRHTAGGVRLVSVERDVVRVGIALVTPPKKGK